MKPSSYQEAIYQEISTSNRNLEIRAVAGSGKTTTLIQASSFLPKDKSNVFLAYNKDIADTLQTRLPSWVEARTIHSMGYRICSDSLGWFKVNGHKVENILKYDLLNWDSAPQEQKQFFFDCGRDIIKLVGLLKNEGITTENDLKESFREIAALHGIDIPNYHWERIFTILYFKSLVFNQGKGTKLIDYDDMILFPVFLNLKFPKFDNIFIDEAQDLNQLQREFLRRLGHESTRYIFVGDPNQAIYGFRGASINSMDLISTEFNTHRLPLSICYRCSASVIQRAKELVPEIEPAETAIPGRVEDISMDTFYSMVSETDKVLCRTNAPLVEVCLELNKKGKPARILGVDIRKSLLRYLKDVAAQDILSEEIDIQMLETFQTTKYDSLIAAGKPFPAKRFLLVMETLSAFVKGAAIKTEEGIKALIDKTFDEQQQVKTGIVLSSIHKVKGLESSRVFILRPDLLPHPYATLDWEQVQEKNLEYVAITRAQEDLYFVY